jgi:hypothetical protein
MTAGRSYRRASLVLPQKLKEGRRLMNERRVEPPDSREEVLGPVEVAFRDQALHALMVSKMWAMYWKYKLLHALLA